MDKILELFFLLSYGPCHIAETINEAQFVFVLTNPVKIASIVKDSNLNLDVSAMQKYMRCHGAIYEEARALLYVTL